MVRRLFVPERRNCKSEITCIKNRGVYWSVIGRMCILDTTITQKVYTKDIRGCIKCKFYTQCNKCTVYTYWYKCILYTLCVTPHIYNIYVICCTFTWRATTSIYSVNIYPLCVHVAVYVWCICVLYKVYMGEVVNTHIDIHIHIHTYTQSATHTNIYNHSITCCMYM